MKLLFEKKRYILSIFLTILMVFCTHISGYADENSAPVFTDGDSTTRSIAENTASGVNIGSVIAATDADNDVLTYTLGGTDASAFRIVSTSGQLQTNVALNYETKSSYSVSVSVSDGNGGSDSIAVTINVTDVNEKPSFNIFGRVTLSVAENTASGTNIGTPFQATDPDSGDTLTYSLQRGDKDSFRINANTGQLRTHAALDYETKHSYSNLAVRATDSQGLVNSVLVTINVTEVNENRAPAFSEGNSTTRSIAKNASSNTNIGTAITATDADNDVLTYTLGGTDASSFSIVSTSGQLRTNAALDRETKTSYSVSISVSDGNGGSDSISVTINVRDVDETPANNAPSFTDGISTTRSVAENTRSGRNIGSPVTATDADTGDALTYTLSGTDASSFSIVSTSGQLQTNAALNYESKSSYSVSISVSDSNGGSDSIAVTINVTDVNEKPSFSISGRVTLSVAENTTSGTNIGTPFQATDPDSGDTLTYSLQRGDKDAFRIDATTGQLQTRAALDYETKRTYNDLAVRATDSQGLINSVLVTINVTNVNENRAPAFSDGTSTTRSIAENTVSGTNIGSAIAATDADNDTLTYTLGGTDASSFSIVSTSGQLQTNAALNYESTSSYSVSVSVSDGNGGSDSIPVTINVTNVNEAPTFATTTTTRAIAENTATNQNIGAALTATDVDSGSTLTYSIPTTRDAAAFSIDSNTGQLKTKDALNYENDTSYTVVVTASDGSLTDTITVTISVTNVNEAPAFATGTSISNISATKGTAITSVTLPEATDPDANTTITYTVTPTLPAGLTFTASTRVLSGTPTAVSASTTYTYTASDSTLSDTLTFTIQVSAPANNPPTFTDGTSTTRSVVENTRSGRNIGSPVAATDTDTGDTLTYTLGGADASSFSIVSTSGQIRTKAALNYESTSSYSVSVSVSDGNGGSDSIPVTINVTDVNEKPSFNIFGRVTLSVAENTASGTNIGTPFQATDPDSGDTLTYSLQRGDKDAFRIDATTGQLQTRAALDYETKSSYSNLAVRATDSKGLVNSVLVTINVTDINENINGNRAPAFDDGSSTTRSVAENTVSGTNIGDPVAATDADTSDTLSYTLSGTDASSFSIVSTSGQLQTSTALDYETKISYSVTVSVSDGNGGSDSIAVTINVTDVNEKPSFSPSGRVTLSVAENTASGTNIGDPFQATDPDSGDTLTYSLQRADKDSFRINANTGQLQTHAALDYETKSSYSKLAVRATDSAGLVSRVLVTINVTNVNETPGNNTPSFTDGTSTTRTVAENTASGTNIGTAVAATDSDSSDTLTYSLGGTDASSFSIVSTSGQLQTSAALDYETKTSYSVTISVSDGNGGSDSIDVTINVTDVNETGATVSTNITTCSVSHKSGNVYDVTIEGTVTGNRNVRFLTVHGYVNDDPNEIGRDSVGFLDAGETKNFSITGTWTHDGSTSQECSVVLTYQILRGGNNAPVAQLVPSETALLPNFPNPFNPETWIPYQLAKPAEVTLTIYDIRGRIVRTLRLGHQPAGMYRSRSKAAHWDGRNQLGEQVATGIYFYTLKAGDYIATRKLLIRK